MNQPPPEANPARNDAVDLEIPVPLEACLDVRIAGDEVRSARIADDEVGDLLGAQSDAIEMIAGLHSSPLEFALEIVGGDRAPLDPHQHDGNDEHDEQRGGECRRDARPKRPAHDVNVRRLGPVEPLVSPPLVHWVLLTRACDDRSRCGMTPARNGSFSQGQILAI